MAINSDFYVKLRVALEQKDVEQAMKVINSEQSKNTTEIKKQLQAHQSVLKVLQEQEKYEADRNKKISAETKSRTEAVRYRQQELRLEQQQIAIAEKKAKIEATQSTAQEQTLAKAKLLSTQMDKMTVSSERVFDSYNKGGTEAIAKSQALQRELADISAELQKQIALGNKADASVVGSLQTRQKQASAELGVMKSTNTANVPTGLMATAGKVLEFGAITMGIGAMMTAVSSATEEVFKLDKALTEYKKVADDVSNGAITNFTQKNFEMGKEVARTGTEAVQATTEFAKAYDNFTVEEDVGLGKVALMFKNVSDEEITAGESASFIISQMKAFNMQASDAEHIIDSVNQISNDFAVSSGDLAENVQKVGSVLAVSNTTFEQTLGLMTAGNIFYALYVQKCA